MHITSHISLIYLASHGLPRRHSRADGNPVDTVHPELVEGFIKLYEWFDRLTMNVVNWITNCIVQFALWVIGKAGVCSGSCLRDRAFEGVTQWLHVTHRARVITT